MKMKKAHLTMSFFLVEAGDDSCPNPPLYHNSKKHTTRQSCVVCFLLVEAGGFGPPKRNATDLQSAPFGHSGTLPHIKFPLPGTCLPICSAVRNLFNCLQTKKWSWWTDSNPRPADYKSAALPTELHQRFIA